MICPHLARRFIPSSAGFTSDCLSMDAVDGDSLVYVGSEGGGKVVHCSSMSRAATHCEMAGHADKVCSVAIDGDTIASGSRDRTIRIWSRASGECMATLHGCADLVHGLALRGDVLLSGEGGNAGGRGRGGVCASGDPRACARLWSVSEAAVAS